MRLLHREAKEVAAALSPVNSGGERRWRGGGGGGRGKKKSDHFC